MDSNKLIIFYLILAVIFAVWILVRYAWGINARRMAYDRGLPDDYFWWGFIFMMWASLLLWMKPKLPPPTPKKIDPPKFDL